MDAIMAIEAALNILQVGMNLMNEGMQISGIIQKQIAEGKTTWSQQDIDTVLGSVTDARTRALIAIANMPTTATAQKSIVV